MSLMGYTEQDIVLMLKGIREAYNLIPKENKLTRKKLETTYDFLDGMLMEGRI